jgi:hypothetical protein
VGSCDDGDACNGVETCNGSTGCVAGTPVTCTALDQCHLAGTCHAGVCNNPAKPDGTVCDDNDPATVNDTCQSGVCGGGGCGTKPRPKPSGYYRGLCNSGESRTYHDNSLTDGDAACVGSLTTTFHGISTVADLCTVFDNDGYGQSDTVRACDKGEIELMSLALNVCRHRVCLDQEIDSDCSGADDVLTSVAASLATADAILSDPHRNKYTCSDARCLASEVNTGRGLPE